MRRTSLAALLLGVVLTSGCTNVSRPSAEVRAAQRCSDRLAGNHRIVSQTIDGTGGRSIPVEIYRPEADGRYPLIAFSHGALAAPDRYRKMLGPIAAAGYVIIAPMHIESEEFRRTDAPPPTEVWRTRVEDLERALDPPAELRAELERQGIKLAKGGRVAMGHSYGALMALISAGAQAHDPSGRVTKFHGVRPKGVVAWSPPGSMPGTIDADGWSKLASPSLTLTGTSDVLSIMAKPWDWHIEGYRTFPPGHKTLWVGRDIDHYFGGSFGRQHPTTPQADLLFKRALSHTVAFLDHATGRAAICDSGPSVEGETVTSG